jgi:hypothetical protein
MPDLTPRPTERTHAEQPQPGADTFLLPEQEVDGSITPADTPEIAGSESEASENRKATPNQGPVAPSRKPQILGLTALAILVLGVLGYAIANVVAYLLK